jgi:hypothetical protein
MNGIWVSGDIPRLDGRKPSCGAPAATRLVSLGLPANPHHPWPAQPDHERSHSVRYGAPASAKSSCSSVHFNMCSFGPVTLNRPNVRSTLILRSETRMEFL